MLFWVRKEAQMNASVCVPVGRPVDRRLKRITAVLLFFLFAVSSCGGNAPGTPTLSIEESIIIIVETAQAVTRTAQASITATPTPTPQEPTPSPPLTATSSLTPIPPSFTPVIINPVYRCQDSEFVKDVTIPDGTVLSPGQVFVKTWKFLNNGNCAWRSDFSIVFLRGDRMRGSDAEIGREVAMDRRLEVSVTMVAPSQPGRYHAHWQLADRHGYPFGDIVTVDIMVANPTPTFTASPAIDRGSLQILMALDNPDGAPLPPNLMVNFVCGTGFTGSISMAPGAPVIVAGIPTGSICTVTEVAPAPIPNYTWGVITYTPPSVVILAKDQTYTITIGNSITRDRGSLQIIKTLNNPDGAPVPAGFLINYNCGAGYTGQMNVAPGSVGTITGIPVGSRCTVIEAVPDPITGFTWGSVTYNPAFVEILAKDQTFIITVGNSITRDRGSLQITKTLNNPDGAPVPSIFTVTYDCGDGYGGSIGIALGNPAIIPGIPYGNTCSVIEAAPDPIPGYLWGAVTYTPVSVVISARDQTFVITVGNIISLDPAPPDDD